LQRARQRLRRRVRAVDVEGSACGRRPRSVHHQDDDGAREEGRRPLGRPAEVERRRPPQRGEARTNADGEETAMKIRFAHDADLEAILPIYNDAVLNTTAVFDYRAQTLDMRREWFRAKQSAKLPVLVAVDDERVLGFASYGPFRAWPAYKYSVELSVYVDKDARGRGIGTTLVRAVVDEARMGQLHVVIAGITAD